MKDSEAFVDHLNGRSHYKALGMSMVVEKVSVERIRQKLAGLKRSRRQAKEMEPETKIPEKEPKIETEIIKPPKQKKQKIEIEEEEDPELAMMQQMGLPTHFG